MVKARVAVLLAGLLCVAAPRAPAQPISASPPPSPAAAGAAPAWKPIYENSQTIYYVGAADVPQTGQSDVETLMEFRIPQVVDGDQVWSIVSHMKLSCDQQRMITLDNTLYALRMGAGPVVESQPANDQWHQPEAGTLGALVWSAACGKK